MYKSKLRLDRIYSVYRRDFFVLQTFIVYKITFVSEKFHFVYKRHFCQTHMASFSHEIRLAPHRLVARDITNWVHVYPSMGLKEPPFTCCYHQLFPHPWNPDPVVGGRPRWPVQHQLCGRHYEGWLLWWASTYRDACTWKGQGGKLSRKGALSSISTGRIMLVWNDEMNLFSECRRLTRPQAWWSDTRKWGVLD